MSSGFKSKPHSHGMFRFGKLLSIQFTQETKQFGMRDGNEILCVEYAFF